jgi:drug/metabolite transporter (DMT)-like permease
MKSPVVYGKNSSQQLPAPPMTAIAHSLPTLPSGAASIRSQWLGWVALLLTLLVWAGFSLSIRFIGQSVLTPGDVALIRFLVPGLVLLPFLPSRLAALRRLSLAHWLMMGIGAGLPFFLLAAAGGRLTSAAHVSALVAGTTPVSFALLGWALWRQPLGRTRAYGLAGIVAGVALLLAGLGGLHSSLLGGAVLLLGASLLWGLYTHGLRNAGLDPLACVMVVTYPSLCVLLPLLVTGVLDSHVLQAAPNQLLLFLLVQGLGVGLLSTLGYALAIRLLGPMRCATVGALAPVLVTLLAIPLLGEQPGWLACCGVLAVTAGVLFSSLSKQS